MKPAVHLTWRATVVSGVLVLLVLLLAGLLVATIPAVANDANARSDLAREPHGATGAISYHRLTGTDRPASMHLLEGRFAGRCSAVACPSVSANSVISTYLPIVRVNYPLPLPRTPRRLSPADGTVTTTQTLTFTWEPRSKGGPVDGYNLKVDGTIFTTTDTISPTILAYGEHTWTVRAYNTSGYSPWASPRWMVYVTDTMPPPSCYPILTTTIDVGDAPHGAAVNSGADRLYVANHADDTLTVINAATFSPVLTVGVGDGPNGVAYNPANDTVYVANRNDDSVSVLRTSDYSLTKTIDVGSQPNGVAVNEVTNRIYVANYGDGTVSVIDGASNTVSDTLAVGSEPSMIAVNTDTNKAYVTLHGEAKVAVIDGAGNASSIDLHSAGPYGIAVDVLRNYVYVATIDSYRIVALNGSDDSYLGWAEIRRLSDGAPAPLRQIGVNPSLASGHIFATTASGDGGWDKFLLLPKGWDDRFARAHALHLNEPREGLVFEPGSNRVYATSWGDDLVAVFLDGEPVCPQNFVQSAGYEVTVCVADAGGNCTETYTR